MEGGGVTAAAAAAADSCARRSNETLPEGFVLLLLSLDKIWPEGDTFWIPVVALRLDKLVNCWKVWFNDPLSSISLDNKLWAEDWSNAGETDRLINDSKTWRKWILQLAPSISEDKVLRGFKGFVIGLVEQLEGFKFPVPERRDSKAAESNGGVSFLDLTFCLVFYK